VSPRCRRTLVAWNAVAPGLGAVMVMKRRVLQRTQADKEAEKEPENGVRALFSDEQSKIESQLAKKGL
jgi:hypothetical protein